MVAFLYSHVAVAISFITTGIIALCLFYVVCCRVEHNIEGADNHTTVAES